MTKLLILINNNEEYKILENVWRERIKKENTSVTIYFLKCDPNLSEDITINNNINTIFIANFSLVFIFTP